MRLGHITIGTKLHHETPGIRRSWSRCMVGLALQQRLGPGSVIASGKRCGSGLACWRSRCGCHGCGFAIRSRGGGGRTGSRNGGRLDLSRGTGHRRGTCRHRCTGGRWRRYRRQRHIGHRTRTLRDGRHCRLRCRIGRQCGGLVAVGNNDRNVHRNRAWLAVKQQRKADYAGQHEHRCTSEPVAGTLAQRLNAFGSAGRSRVLFAIFAEFEKCHECADGGEGPFSVSGALPAVGVRPAAKHRPP